jgi:hypothetical protein
LRAKEDSAKEEFNIYRKFKDIQSIDSIGKFNDEFAKFGYVIQPVTEKKYDIEFI